MIVARGNLGPMRENIAGPSAAGERRTGRNLGPEDKGANVTCEESVNLIFGRESVVEKEGKIGGPDRNDLRAGAAVGNPSVD